MSETPLTVTEIRLMAFVDREKQTFSRYAELFPNYEWTDSATAIDLMAAEIKCLRSELLDACRLATSMREFAKPPTRATTLRQAHTDIMNLLANLDVLLEADSDGMSLEDDDRAIVEDIRRRWMEAMKTKEKA